MMRTSVNEKSANRERYASRPDQQYTGYNMNRIYPNGSAHYEPPRPMEPEPSHAAWNGSQQVPYLSRQLTSSHPATHWQEDSNAQQVQRLPGVRDLLSSRNQLDSPSQQSPQYSPYLPPFPQISPESSRRDTIAMAPEYTRAKIKYPSNQSSPTSPFFENQQSSVQAQQYFAMQEDRRSESVPAYSARRETRPPAVTARTEFEQASSTRTVPDYAVRPRCIGERNVPGEGNCFFYEDGTYCPTVVDGEPVNPSWGVTKAGKARKRLAQACLTCREKKIRCEPGFPKCTQCEKTGRNCKL